MGSILRIYLLVSPAAWPLATCSLFSLTLAHPHQRLRNCKEDWREACCLAQGAPPGSFCLPALPLLTHQLLFFLTHLASHLGYSISVPLPVCFGPGTANAGLSPYITTGRGQQWPSPMSSLHIYLLSLWYMSGPGLGTGRHWCRRKPKCLPLLGFTDSRGGKK